MEFEATVRIQGSKKFIETGKISSIKLVPFVGKKVKVVIEVVE